MLGAVVGDAAIVPLLDGVVVDVLGGGPVERTREADGDAVRFDVDGLGQMHRLARVANSKEAAGHGSVRTPAEQTADVKLPVARVEPAAHDPGGKVRQRKTHHAALHGVFQVLDHHQKNLARAVGKRKELAFQGPPLVARHPDLLGGRAVDVVRDPADGRVVLVGPIAPFGQPVIAAHVAVEPARLDPVDPVLRRPMAFLIADNERAVIVDQQTVGCAETVGDDAR